MAAISGKLARIRYGALTATSSTNQAATLSSADNKTLTINTTARRRWDPTSTHVHVYSNEVSTGLAVSSSLYTVDHAVGRARFSVASATSFVYTVDVPWLATSYLTQAKAWTLNTNVNMLDCTAFSTASTGRAWRSFVPGLTDATVTVSRFFDSSSTGPIMVDRALLGSPFYLELVLNSTDQAQYVCYGRIESDQFNANVGDLITEEVTFKPTGQVYFTT